MKTQFSQKIKTNIFFCLLALVLVNGLWGLRLGSCGTIMTLFLFLILSILKKKYKNIFIYIKHFNIIFLLSHPYSHFLKITVSPYSYRIASVLCRTRITCSCSYFIDNELAFWKSSIKQTVGLGRVFSSEGMSASKGKMSNFGMEETIESAQTKIIDPSWTQSNYLIQASKPIHTFTLISTTRIRRSL